MRTVAFSIQILSDTNRFKTLHGDSMKAGHGQKCETVTLLFIYSEALLNQIVDQYGAVILVLHNLYYNKIRSQNAGVYKLYFRFPQVLSCRKNSFVSPDILLIKSSKCLYWFQTQFYHNCKYKPSIWQKHVE